MARYCRCDSEDTCRACLYPRRMLEREDAEFKAYMSKLFQRAGKDIDQAVSIEIKYGRRRHAR